MSGSKINKLSKKAVLIALMAVIIILAASIIYKNYYDRSSKSTPEPASTINLDPPTEQELSETAAHKEKLANESTTDNAATDTGQYGKTKVTPVITSVNQDELRAYISGTFEDGGTCIATFKQGTLSFTKQSTGFANVNTTNCSVIKLDRSDFANSGEWAVTVEYTSDNSTGISEQSKFGVQ